MRVTRCSLHSTAQHTTAQHDSSITLNARHQKLDLYHHTPHQLLADGICAGVEDTNKECKPSGLAQLHTLLCFCFKLLLVDDGRLPTSH
jgi:hypothetical protein